MSKKKTLAQIAGAASVGAATAVMAPPGWVQIVASAIVSILCYLAESPLKSK